MTRMQCIVRTLVIVPLLVATISLSGLVIAETTTTAASDGTNPTAMFAHDGEAITVRSTSNQTLSGETTLDPGTEITIQVKSKAGGSPFLKHRSTTVSAQGTFTAVFNFSDVPVGTEFVTRAAYHNGSRIVVLTDEVDGKVVNGSAEPSTTTDTVTPSSTPRTQTTDTSGQAGFGFIAGFGAVLAALIVGRTT